jgi:hypothetical protein
MIKKKKNITIWLIILGIILILASASGFAYFQIDQTTQISKTLQQNINLINQNSLKNTEIIDQVFQKTQQLPEIGKVKEYQQNLTDLQKKIADFSDETNQTKNSLKSLQNPDLQEFNLQTKKLLDFRVQYLETANNILTLNACYADKTDLLYNWLPATNESWVKLNSQTEATKVAELATQTATKVDQNNSILKELKDCFGTNFSDSLNNDIDISLQKESQDYNNISASLKKLASSLQILNSSDYQSGVTEIQKITQTESPFLKKMNQTLNETIRQNLTKSQQKTADQEIILNRIIDNLEAKYQLNTNL